VGGDFLSEHWKAIENMASDISGIVSLNDEKCFFWEGCYSDDFEVRQTIRTELNVFEKFNPRVPEHYKEKDSILFLANMDPSIQKQILIECKDSKWKILDTMNYWISNSREKLNEVFGLVDGIIINEEEAFLLTGEKNVLLASERLFSPNLKLIIVKRGANGMMAFGKDFCISLPAFPLREVVDPTGAGDSFAGGFVSYLDFYKIKQLNRRNVKRAAIYATVVASFCVEDFGLDGIRAVTTRDIEKRLKSFREMIMVE